MAMEKDDFWDLEKLLPARKKRVSPPAFPVSTVSVTSGEEAPARKENKLSFAPPSAQVTEEETWMYRPEENPLIESVSVHRRPSVFRSYRQFFIQGERYFHECGEMCESVPFFSYMPQYSHMDDCQRAYYFYWRDCVRKGEYLPCSISYLYLFFYEIINFPHLLPPKEGSVLFAKTFAAYAKDHPKIVPYLSVWLTDYCLVHGVSCPVEGVRRVLPEVLSSSNLKELYLGDFEHFSHHRAEALLALSSDYQWQRGRYAEGEHSELFKKHIPQAALCVIPHLRADGVIATPYGKMRKRYEAFCGALLAGEKKCVLEVEYYPVAHTESLRRVLTAVVKYAENRLRSHLSIKSRLSVPPFPAKYKAAIDAYMQEALPQKKVAVPVPEYEKQYDALSVGVSFEEAALLETASWEVTRLLVEEEETEEEEALPTVMERICTPDSAEEERRMSQVEGQFSKEKEIALFLSAMLAEKREECRRLCAAIGKSEEAFCLEINEKFYDIIGDAVLESNGVEYTVIPDYREEVMEWISLYAAK